MDLWVVAAATGAACIAKYLQNQSSKDPEEASSSQPIPGNSIHGQSKPRNFLQKIRDRTFPSPGLARNQTGPNLSLDTEETNRLDDIQATGEASTSGFQESENRNEVKNEFSDQSGDLLTGFSIREVGVFGSVSRSRQRRCRSNGYIVKPVSSLESCFVAQELYREHARMEEYVYNSIQSPSKLAVRPLLVTDSSRVISTSFNKEIKMQSEGLEGQRKLKPSIGKARSRRLSSSSKRVSSGGAIHSQGSSNGMFLFFLGITIGIMSTIVASKREVDKLNDQLKQTKNLVENLHKELEMKDLFTIKELSNENFESCGTKEFSFLDRTPIASSIERELDKSTDDDKEPDNQRVENSEAMSKIEAELEVELERLELNMKTYSLERISDYVELDPDFVVDVVHGDLIPDNVNRQPGVLSDSDHDVSGTSTNHTYTANYTVSPRELSLRLHEVIQLQLEARIKELENALETSQKRLHSKESKHIISQSDLYPEKESSSTQESRAFMDGPLFVDSGEALDAYKTHEEITRMTITDEEALSQTIYYSDCIKKEFNPIDQNLCEGQNGDGGGNGFISQCDIIEERWSRNLDHDKISNREENTSSRWGSYEIGESEDVDEDDDDVAEVLIKRIVEKAKQGSSVVLNAQRMLYSIDDQLIS